MAPTLSRQDGYGVGKAATKVSLRKWVPQEIFVSPIMGCYSGDYDMDEIFELWKERNTIVHGVDITDHTAIQKSGGT